MNAEDVLSHPPRALSQARRELCFESGSLAAGRFVDGEWLKRLHRIALEFGSPPPTDRGRDAMPPA